MDNYEIRDYVAADGVEMLAQYPGDHTEDEKWCAEAEGFSVIYEGKLALCAGIIKERKGVGQAWSLYPPDVGKYHIDPKIARDKLRELMIEHDFWRVFATVRCDFPAGAKYIEWLGFKREGRLKQNEPDKTDSFLYAIVR
ncbi:hypothetical protein LCGC14_0358450 [marine sediment metagenome]|uniref:N-acetyltransferase domain-containing protein n=1 Tax=marine sediment metagenome TaxID=412755 RepID=A0A0F9T8M0_9ZZZZ